MAIITKIENKTLRFVLRKIILLLVIACIVIIIYLIVLLTIFMADSMKLEHDPKFSNYLAIGFVISLFVGGLLLFIKGSMDFFSRRL